MSPGFVSVIIPSYNCAEFICEAVESAIAQTYADIEIIVVDSGSDGTRELLARYSERIQYIYQSPQGLSAARNLAIRQAKGEWIALLDADDVWHPEKTELQLRAAARLPGCALVSSAASHAMPPMLEPEPQARELSVTDFLLSTPIGPSGTLLRRDALDAAGMFDESLPFVEDRDMWLRMAARFPCLFVDSPCWWHRKRAGQMSRDAIGNHAAYKRVLRKFLAEQPAYRRMRRAAWSYFYESTAWMHFQEGYRARAFVHLMKSCWLHPREYRLVKRAQWHRAKTAVRYLAGDRVCRFFRLGAV